MEHSCPFLLIKTYYAISSCVLQDKILLDKVVANCGVFFECWVTSVDLEGQGSVLQHLVTYPCFMACIVFLEN